MNYQYGEWTEVKMSYDKPQVISVFLCRVEEFEGLRVAYGGHRRSGLVSTAKLIRNSDAATLSAVGLEYSELKLVTNKDKHEEETATKLEEWILAHCLLLPYVLPNKIFNKIIAVVFDEWSVGSVREPKKETTPCETVLSV
jgi:hypothetical protein